MSDASLRMYLGVLRRQWWVILLPALIVGGIALGASRRAESSSYHATTTLSVDSNVGPDGNLPVQPDNPSVFQRPSTELSPVTASALIREALSEPVVTAAAAKVPGETPISVARGTRTGVNGTEFTLTLQSTAPTAARAVAVANALSASFIANRQTRQADAIKAQIDDYAAQYQSLQSRIADLNAQTAAASFQGTDTSSFEASRSVLLAQYQSLLEGQQQLQTALRTGRTGIEVALPAVAAATDAPADPLVRGLTGAAIGLLLGIALAALREVLDTRLRSPEEGERLAGVPVVAELPKDRDLKRRAQLPVLDRPDSSFAEAMRALHTSLRLSTQRDRVQSIVITSPQRGDGRTTVAANLAAASALAGVRTILVSGDLREGAPLAVLSDQGRSSRLAPPGLRNLLSSDDRFIDLRAEHAADGSADSDRPQVSGFEVGTVSSLLVATRVPNLRWLPAGSLPARGSAPTNPAELLSSPRARAVLAALRELADFVVIDSPPTVVADSVLLAAGADGVLMVAALRETNRDGLGRAVAIVRSTPTRILGLVVNRSRSGGGYSTDKRDPKVASRAVAPIAVLDLNGASNGSSGASNGATNGASNGASNGVHEGTGRRAHRRRARR